MFGSSIKLFKILGFEVKMNPTWLIVAALIVWSLAKGVFPHYYKDFSSATYWWMGVIGALGLFVSIIVHELAHSLVARRFGMPIKGITLFIFGGVAEMNEEPPSAKSEFFMA
ncbi:site-2 protease family protein, partial [candidate division KSB1 bacterium]|nr:site-2 protease family protein [candidate division KSB1 bacterium]